MRVKTGGLGAEPPIRNTVLYYSITLQVVLCCMCCCVVELTRKVPVSSKDMECEWGWGLGTPNTVLLCIYRKSSHTLQGFPSYDTV